MLIHKLTEWQDVIGISKIQKRISENTSEGDTLAYLRGIGEQKSMDSFSWFALSQHFIFIGS